ncbi:MAG: TetR/AcrR family transcriptional regulator [Desulfobacterales bacterium]|nr:TetR/AcrR family transcriptional regulator [Desulfobacterales bacterium]
MGRPSKSEARKKEIIEHLYEVLSINGLRDTTLSKVAKHMGVNSSLLIHYFDSKDDMFIALADQMFSRYEDFYLNDTTSEEDSKIVLHKTFHKMFNTEWDSTEDSVYWALFYLGYRVKAVKDRDIKFKENLVKHLCEHISKVDAGDEIKSEDPEVIAFAIMAMGFGIDYLGSAMGYDNKKICEAGYFLKNIIKSLLGINSK